MYVLILSGVLLGDVHSGVAARRAADPGAAEALRKFLAWSEDLAALPSVHFAFALTHTELGKGEVLSGRYDFDALEGRAYLEYTHKSTDTPLPDRTYASWNDGVGFQLRISGIPRRRRVMKYLKVPQVFGLAHMPSDHPCFPGLRSLASSLEGKGVRAERLSASENSYRLSFFRGTEDTLEDGSTRLSGTWTVYLMDPTAEGILLEERLYFTDQPAFPIESPLIPEGLELPEDYQARYLHMRKEITGYRSLGKVSVPTGWKTTLPSSLGRADLRVDEDTLGTGLSPVHEYRVPLVASDVVHDIGRGVNYLAGDDPMDIAPSDGDITEAKIDELLRESGMAATPAHSPEREVSFPSSCAANCVYVLLSAVHRPTALHEIQRQLGLRPGDAFTDLRNVSDVLSRNRVESLAVEREAESLRETGDIPVLVHAEKPGAHFYLVRDYRRDDDTLQVIDPPEPVVRRKLEEVARTASGVMLLFDPESVRATSASVTSVSYSRWFWLSLSGGLGVVSLALLVQRSRRPAKGASA